VAFTAIFDDHFNPIFLDKFQSAFNSDSRVRAWSRSKLACKPPVFTISMPKEDYSQLKRVQVPGLD
jgi:hypothetical protein